MRVKEAIGRAIGGILAPLAAEGSLVRGTRLVHADGVVYRAAVSPLVLDGPCADLAQKLAGAALLRFSGAIWRGPQAASMPDILGAALRFSGVAKPTERAQHGDQDLIFATLPSVWHLAIAPFLTNTRDFLANTYSTALPYRIEGLGRVKFRLVTSGVGASGVDRRARLMHAVSMGLGVLHLEIKLNQRGAAWIPIAGIELTERADLDQEKLCFNPFRDGRGIVPAGLLQAVRAAVYPASQLGRRIARGPR